MDEKNRMLILTGPTAVGKTSLSISLAKRIGGEIVSADSMQVYKYMDIGSAKITKKEMEGIPHHLIDVLMPDEEFHVFRFQEMAKEAIKGIYERGHIPIIVGGTGFYIQALLYDVSFSQQGDHGELRAKLEEVSRDRGGKYLHEWLGKVDADSAEMIHPNNRKRVIRALEFYILNGYPISEHNRKEREKEAAYDHCYFVLNDDRAHLYQKIDERVDMMLAAGLVDEVKRLKDMGFQKGMVSMQGLGYKEMLSYLDGECTLEQAVALIKRDTRHFAKRQLTWFRRERDVIWIEKQDFGYDHDKILNYMMERFQER